MGPLGRGPDSYDRATGHFLKIDRNDGKEKNRKKDEFETKKNLQSAIICSPRLQAGNAIILYGDLSIVGTVLY